MVATAEILPLPVRSDRQTAPAVGFFRVLHRQFELDTTAPIQFVDVTDRVAAIVAESGVGQGVAVVFSQHTTAGIAINEGEPLLMDDMVRSLEAMAPRDAYYRHDDLSIRTENLEPEERPNGHAHCQRLSVGASENIPVVNGRLQLGRWQRVFFVELDGARHRAITVQVMGVQ